MPPRATGRGGRGGRGGASNGPAIRGNGTAQLTGLPTAGAHITTVGVKRPGFGNGGKPLPIFVNSFVTTVPDSIIHHYDGMSIL